MARVLARGRATIIVGRAESAKDLIVTLTDSNLLHPDDPNKNANVVVNDMSNGRLARTSVSFDVSVGAEEGNAYADLARKIYWVESRFMESSSSKRTFGRVFHDGATSTLNSVVVVPFDHANEEPFNETAGKWVEPIGTTS